MDKNKENSQYYHASQMSSVLHNDDILSDYHENGSK